VLWLSLKFWLQKKGLGRFRMLNPEGRRLVEDYYDEVGEAGPNGGSSQPPDKP
jgi:hypothetical protein